MAKNSFVLAKGLRVFRQKFTGADGESQTAAKWYIEFKFDDLPRRVPGFTDRQQTEDLARQIQRLAMCRESNTQIDGAVSQWVELMTPALRKRLARIGVLDGLRLSAHESLDSHLADWKTALLAKGNTEPYATLRKSRVERVFNGCDFATWADLSKAGAASKVQGYLSELRQLDRGKEGGIGGQTFNYHISAIKGFCRWMIGDNRASVHPFVGLQGVGDAESDATHERRALSLDEMRLLLSTTTTKSVNRYGIIAADRARLYRFAYESGMRPNQIRSLTVSSFSLETSPPTVAAAAKHVKRRKRHVPVLTPSMAEDLREAFTTRFPTASAFAMPDKYKMADMVREDLAAAREEWIKEAPEGKPRIDRQKSDFLAHRDHQGLVVDFYSLRHTHGTLLAEAGASQKDVQASLHHAQGRTTERYLHTSRQMLTNAMATLPRVSSVPSEAHQATGTDDKMVNLDASLPCSLPRNSAHNVYQGDTKRGVTGKNEGSEDMRKPLENSRLQPDTMDFEGMSAVGIEPTTYGLKVRCSTN